MKQRKLTMTAFWMAILCVVVMMVCGICATKKDVYAVGNENLYEVKIVMPDGTTKWLGSGGVSTVSATRLSEGSALAFANVKASFLQNGGLREGKVFANFKNQNNTTFTWTGGVVPNLDSFKNPDGIILLTPNYTNEFYCVDYYVAGEFVTSVQLILGASLIVPEIEKEGYVIAGFTDNVTGAVYYNDTIWDLSYGTEVVRSFIQLEPNYNSAGMTIQLVGESGNVQKQIFNVFYNNTLTGLDDGNAIVGKTFIGWFISRDANAKEYTNGMAWDVVAVGDNQIVKLYARYEIVTYTIVMSDDIDTDYPNITYTIYSDPFYLDIPKRAGKTFSGWSSGTGYLIHNYIIPSQAHSNLGVSGYWINDVVVTNSVSVNIIENEVSLDFRNALTIGFNFRTYNIKSSVSKLYLKNSGTTTTSLGLGFIIEDRTTPLDIVVDSIRFTALGKNLFHAQDANTASLKAINGTVCMEVSGDTKVNFLVRGTNYFSGSPRLEYSNADTANPAEYHSAIIVGDLGIYGETADANLTISGGNGAPSFWDGDTLVDNINAGSAVWAHNVTINIPNLEVTGGSALGHFPSLINLNYALVPTALETAGENGRRGANSGSGRYAFNVSRSITVLSGYVRCVGGDGGSGSKGEDGQDAGYMYHIFNNGYNGGNGGNGGSGGNGYDALSGAAVVTGTIITVKGTPGRGAPGGKAGKGGGTDAYPVFGKIGLDGYAGANGIDGK